MHINNIILTIMNIFNFLSLFYRVYKAKPKNVLDPQLVKYFKTEFGSSWKLELDKYTIRNESNNGQKAA